MMMQPLKSAIRLLCAMIALLALVGPRVFRGRFLIAARRQVETTMQDDIQIDQPEVAEQSPSIPWKSRRGWADAASYTISDLRMLRRELVAGFVVAGFLAVAVLAHQLELDGRRSALDYVRRHRRQRW